MIAVCEALSPALLVVLGALLVVALVRDGRDVLAQLHEGRHE